MDIKIHRNIKSGPYYEINPFDVQHWSKDSIFLEECIFLIFLDRLYEDLSGFNYYGPNTLKVTKTILVRINDLKECILNSLSMREFTEVIKKLPESESFLEEVEINENNWKEIKQNLINICDELFFFLMKYETKIVSVLGI